MLIAVLSFKLDKSVLSGSATSSVTPLTEIFNPLIAKSLVVFVYFTPFKAITASRPSIFAALLPYIFEESVSRPSSPINFLEAACSSALNATDSISGFPLLSFITFPSASFFSTSFVVADDKEKSAALPVFFELTKIRPLLASKLAFNPLSFNALTTSWIVLSFVRLTVLVTAFPSSSVVLILRLASSPVNPSSLSFVSAFTAPFTSCNFVVPSASVTSSRKESLPPVR